jgi:hypothetical protein
MKSLVMITMLVPTILVTLIPDVPILLLIVKITTLALLTDVVLSEVVFMIQFLAAISTPVLMIGVTKTWVVSMKK